jgi:glycosyltransferase involved in cell wall biosynthesis
MGYTKWSGITFVGWQRKMKVIFALRGDAPSKPGGDSKKVQRYITGLTSRGWECEVVYTPETLERASGDLVHLMNLDLPLENLRYARVAQSRGLPMVLSTIRHPIEGIIKMYNLGDDSFYVFLRKIGIPPLTGIGMRERVKLMRRGWVRDALSVGSYEKLQGQLIGSAQAVFPMAQGEYSALAADFPALKQQFIVRNGMSFSSHVPGAKRPKAAFDIITVGRIEPRKNSLALARAAHSAGLRTLFVGALNEKHGTFIKEFINTVEKSEFLTYAGSKTPDELRDLYLSADAYLNPAWFEVVSQADVEAASLGLRVISTDHSYIDDALGQGVARMNPASISGSDAVAHLIDAFQAAECATPPANRDWDSCGAELDSAYRWVLGILPADETRVAKL